MNTAKVQGSLRPAFNISDFLTPDNAVNTLVFCIINGVLGGYVQQQINDRSYAYTILSFAMPKGTAQNTHRAAANILPLLKNIAHIKMSGLGMTNMDFITLSAQPSREDVTELNLYEYRDRITDENLAEIAKLCPNLTSIDLGMCTLITREGIRKLILRCPNLASISLAPSFSHNINPLIETISRLKPAHLTSIDLSESPTVTDASIQLLAKNCPNLRSIKLGGMYPIRDESIEALAKNNKLIAIDLRGCCSLTDAAIESLANQCPDLEKINLSYCQDLTDKALFALAKGCPKLSSIHLVECKKITTQGVQAIAVNKNLAFIDLSFCAQITDPAIESLAECTKLATVNLYGCNQITENAFVKVIRSCPELSIVHLGSSYFITDQTMMTFAKNSRNLLELRLKPLTGVISEKALISFIEMNPELEVFDHPIGTAAMLAFAQNCPNLREITLANSITDDAFDELLRGCSMLTSVEFLRGTQIPPYSIHELLSESPSIMRIIYDGFSADELGKIKLKYPQVNFMLPQ